MDLIMGQFADATLASMTEAELADFERLGDVSDHDIYAWIAGEQPVAPAHDTALFRRLRAFSEGVTRAS